MDVIGEEWLRFGDIVGTAQDVQQRREASCFLQSIYLLDRSASMVAAWSDAFESEPGVMPVRGDFARFMAEHPEIDCVVSPASS